MPGLISINAFLSSTVVYSYLDIRITFFRVHLEEEATAVAARPYRSCASKPPVTPSTPSQKHALAYLTSSEEAGPVGGVYR